ncbi:hypothetical protein Pfo_011070 [Paulownia fortunei]|nr:hypothetical protein Pfo_011070 [Paulownia fortunei]
MADAAVTFLLKNVSQLLISYADLISGAEDELQHLKNELDLLKAFLRAAANKPKKEESFREMERQIKEVVYDVEDTIDSCLTQAAASKGKNILRRGLNPKRVSLAKEVKSLREDKVKPMFDRAKMDFANMQIGDGSGTSLEEHRTIVKKVPSIRQESVVGFEDEEVTIINHLMEEREELDVISIIGMPGLGKTTLALKIYHNQKIQYEFPTRIWVYVSQEFNKKDLFLNILKEFTSKDMSSLSDDDLAQTVRASLGNRKFLLVMDDVWTAEAWDTIRDALPNSHGKGKVLITSRLREVAMHANPTRGYHYLRFLRDDESWELLQLKVFGKLQECPQELIGIGKYITKKCDGLPLAIVMMGGILVDQFSTTQSISAIIKAWEEVSENMSMYLRDDYLSYIVALSYNKLRDDLRDCFLYLGVFPEDYEIPAWTLTLLWIAEGFIQPKRGQSLEETAEENLKDLINRNLVMVDEVRLDGKVKTCRIHDMVRDFCIAVAGRNENLFQEIRKYNEGIFEPALQKHRRLCIHSNVWDFFSSEPYVPRVRSFLCFSKDELILLPEDISKIPGAFELLRVLDLKSIRFTRFPLELTQLIHLRYIALSSDFKVLPEAVSSLWNTQTLIIHTSSRTLVVKADIWKMIQLRHVKTNASMILLKKPANNGGKNLQTLANISPESCTIDVFDQTPYLKKLGIRGRLATLLDGKVGSRKLDSLGKLRDLENLKLLNDVYTITPSEGRLPRLPLSDEFPPKLRSLTLSGTYLNWEQMYVLGMLGNLEVLKLKENAFVGECWEVMDGGFRFLEVLQIGYTNLVSWKASGHNFPSLRCLMLRNCEELEALPEGLATVPSLQVIDLHRPSKTAAASARKIQQEILALREKSRSSGFKLSIFPPDE